MLRMTMHVEGVSEPKRAEVEDSAKAPSLGKRFFNLRTLLSFGLGFAILVGVATYVRKRFGDIETGPRPERR